MQKIFPSKFLLPLFGAAALFSLYACGGDSSSNSEEASEVGTSVGTLDDLPNCTSKREGEEAYVEEDDATYVCEDGKWSEKVPEVESSGSKLTSSATAEVESSSSEITSSASEKPESSGSESTSSAVEEPGSSSSSKEVSSSSSEPESSSEISMNSSTAAPCNVDGENNYNYGTLTDSRDGQTYKTVTIGDQVWMAENLNYAYTGVPYNYSGYTSESTSWCYNDEPSNCAKYGRLYTWAAAVGKTEEECGYENECNLPSGNIQGVCPEGWHLPSKTEFETLFTAVGGQDSAGTTLKSTSGWYNDGNGTDAFGFSALPAGGRNYYGSYYLEGSIALFWSSTEYDSYYAYDMYLDYSYGIAGLGNGYKGYGFSVRCLKD